MVKRIGKPNSQEVRLRRAFYALSATKHIYKWQCEICKKVYTERYKARLCEAKHKGIKLTRKQLYH